MRLSHGLRRRLRADTRGRRQWQVAMATDTKHPHICCVLAASLSLSHTHACVPVGWGRETELDDNNKKAECRSKVPAQET